MMPDPTPLAVFMAMNSIHAPLVVRGDEAAGASFSECERYRYTLWRTWDESKARVLWIMLNPSTADELKLDPTVTRCKGFSEAWGYGGLIVTNLFAWRATKPEDMKAADDPIGPNNDSVISYCASEVIQGGGIVICAWSQHGKLKARGLEVKNKLWLQDIPLHYLRMGANGQPHHPLYLPGDLKPTQWV